MFLYRSRHAHNLTSHVEESSSKKRSTYLLTHGKANEAPSHESNQNRFRIYFESPPEADRIPQALRRNPYKRWRRASSSVAPSRQGDDAERERGKDQDKSEKAGGEKDGAVAKLPEVAEEGEDAAALGTEESAEATKNAGSTVDGSHPTPVAATEHASAEVTSESVPIPSENSGDVQNGQPGDAESVHPVGTALDVEQSTTLEDSGLESIESQAIAPTDGNLVATSGEASESVPLVTPDEPEALAVPEGEERASAPLDTSDSVTNGDDSALPATTESVNGDDLHDTSAPEPAAPSTDPANSAELSAALAQSAENAASAYKSRTRRRSSVSSTDSRDTIHAFQPEVTPSTNRLSILYEGSQRRMCFDAEVVDKIRVYREEGRIEVLFKPQREEKEDDESGEGDTLLPKGFLVSFRSF